MGSISKSPSTQLAASDEADELCLTLDQVIRKRAKTHKEKSLISYPEHETDFVDYTGADLDRITRHAARAFAQKIGQVFTEQAPIAQDEVKSQRHFSTPDKSVVALVGVSSFAYYVTFLALQRLGITTMFISPRLADQGYAHLLNATGCRIAIASGPSFSTLESIRHNKLLADDLSLLPMIDNDFIKASLHGNSGADDVPDFVVVNAGEDQGFIIHSGGTTGLPKPVPLKASAWLLQANDIVRRIPRADTLSTLPLFHSFGLATLLRALVNGTRLSLLNAARPVTAAIIQDGLDLTGSQALVTVPYTLKFLAEADGGLQRLGQLRQVINAGSAIPDDLGDKVVAAGTNIFHLYGQTESGALMEPPKDRLLWSWVTPLPHAAPFLKFESEGNDDQNLYHLIVLPGLKQKVFSDRPDGSYGTKDLFQRHPTDKDLWKFVARKDDIIVLLNGEKADPIPLEEAVTANPNVRVAVAFGAGQESLGLIVIRSEKGAPLSHEQFLECIMCDLELGNSRVPAYAKVSKEMVIVKDADTQFPATDKSTVIRPRFLKSFSEDIEEVYRAKQRLKFDGVRGEPMSEYQIMEIVSRAVRDVLRPSVQDSNGALSEADQMIGFKNESDFFDLGLDSLQASNIRSRLLREVNLAGGSLATNVVFDHPTVDLLAQHLIQVRSGQLEAVDETKMETMARAMIEKYSQFGLVQPGTQASASTDHVVSDNTFLRRDYAKHDDLRIRTEIND